MPSEPTQPQQEQPQQEGGEDESIPTADLRTPPARGFGEIDPNGADPDWIDYTADAVQAINPFPQTGGRGIYNIYLGAYDAVHNASGHAQLALENMEEDAKKQEKEGDTEGAQTTRQEATDLAGEPFMRWNMEVHDILESYAAPTTGAETAWDQTVAAIGGFLVAWYGLGKVGRAGTARATAAGLASSSPRVAKATKRIKEWTDNHTFVMRVASNASKDAIISYVAQHPEASRPVLDALAEAFGTSFMRKAKKTKSSGKQT